MGRKWLEENLFSPITLCQRAGEQVEREANRDNLSQNEILI